MTTDDIETAVGAFRAALAPTSAKTIAAKWCELTDDEQAQFFIEVARLMAEWTPYNRGMQLFAIGRHLKDCACSSDEARAIVLEIADGITSPGAETLSSEH